MAAEAHLFHEIKQTLRVTGVHPALRDWPFLSELWEAVRPNAETRAFEEAAARIRSEAVTAADQMGRVASLSRAQLGESQAFQVEASLLMYHYLDAKLLLLASAAAAGCKGEPQAARAQLIERGAPGRMTILEVEDGRPADEDLRRVYREARKVLGVSEVPVELRTLALWPKYLISSWDRLKPMAKSGAFARASRHILDTSRALARNLPYPVQAASLRHPVLGLEAALPKIILCVALFSLDWQAPELLRRSPFPARARGK
jgi:hypothetical protein